MQKVMKLPVALYEATDNLIQNLLAAEAFLTYQQSQVRLDASPEALDLLKRLSAAQADVRRKQGSHSVTPANISELRTLQVQVTANPVISEYVNAQQGAVDFLREINDEISQLLGMDFASLARKGCC
jgi:cell fate (sporulation/competence/biofilm development) regulator YlbF (YheA/YmcA/DUF963 family)